MATENGGVGRFCRFCLRGEGLMALSEASNSAFSIADAEHFTGITLSKDDHVSSYVVCYECCLTIKNSICFRLSCLNNDITFRKLVSLLKARTKDKAAKNELQTVDSSIVIDSDSEHSTDDETQNDETVENDAAIVSLNDTDSDNSMHSHSGEAVPTISEESKYSFDNSMNNQPASIVDTGRQKENAACSKQPNLKTGKCKASELVPSLDEKVNCSLGGKERENSKNEAVEGSVESNQMFSYSSDSNDSLPSLYEEVMQKAIEEEKTKIIATIAVNRELVPALDERVNCPLGATNETEKEAVEGTINRVESNLTFTYSSDSNDSLPSIYEESIRQAIEDLDSAIAKPDVAPNPIDKIRHVCPICGGLFVDIHHHIERSHGTEKKFACSHCQKKFQSMFHLKRHSNTWHEKRIILTCEHCGKGFTNHGSYFYHIKNSHGKSDVYQCETCPSKFKSIDGYRKHLKLHSITSHPCQHCDKFFKSLLTLEKHQLRYHPS